MTRYSVQPIDRIFVEGYGFLFFPKNMGKNIGKNINKKLKHKTWSRYVSYASETS